LTAPDDRRSRARCPVCQGPALEDATAPEGIRCRRSVCIHNHAAVACPRCKKQDLDSVAYQKGRLTFVCKECTNTWEVVVESATPAGAPPAR
jgi:hypothetical protein